MSTRSYIGIQNKSGKSIKYVYCHNDSYPEGVGRTLFDHYKTRQKVFRLIANGDLSVLEARINPRTGRPHSFDGKRQKDVCIFYERDRGETGGFAEIAMSPESLLKNAERNFIEYVYYIDNDNVWWASNVGNGGKGFVKLEVALGYSTFTPRLSIKINPKKTVDSHLSPDIKKIVKKLEKRFV